MCYDFKPHTHLERMSQISNRKKPAGIFLDSMGDWLDCQISNSLAVIILRFIAKNPQHRFYLLTKQAQRLPNFKYPSNLWLGVTINRRTDGWRIGELVKTNAAVKFISFEPLYEDLSDNLDLSGIQWVIVGAETRNGKVTVKPDDRWVWNIILEAQANEIPIFVKDNLHWDQKNIIHSKYQEFPKVG